MSAEAVIFRYSSVGFSFVMYADRLEVQDASPLSHFRKAGGRGTIPFGAIQDVSLDPRTHALRIATDDAQHSFILGNGAHQAHYLLRAALARYVERQRAHTTRPRPRRLLHFLFGLVAVLALLLVAVAGWVGGSALFGQKATPTTAPVFAAPSTCVKQLCVHYIDVGQGDSIFLQAPDGTTALIDGGDPGSGALTYLQKNSITRIDLMFLTHPHRDHVGGLTDVLNNLKVGQVITTGAIHTTPDYTRFLDAIERKKVAYKEVKQGDSIGFGALTFTVLHALRDADNLNDTSLVLRLVYKDVSFLFTGDAEAVAEGQMLRTGAELGATILKVGHHGSKTSSTPAFLAAVQPKVAIYSAGRDNPYDHPDKTTLANLKSVGAQVYGTNVHGTIVVATNGATYHVSPQMKATPQPSTVRK